MRMQNWFSRLSLSRPTAVVGREGEMVAERRIRLLGYRVLDRNVRVDRDEIDLLAYDPTDRVLAFIEVKARRRGGYDPAINVTPRKRAAMSRAARTWMERERLGEIGYRLDLLCVEDGRVTQHLKDLAWSEPEA
jgi:putative endonuclease